MDTASVKLSIPDEVDPVSIMGGGDAVLRAIEERTGARIVVRGRQISLSGSAEEVELLTRLFTFLIKEARVGDTPSVTEVERAMQTLRESVMDLSGFRDDILLTYRGKAIRPKTVGQKRYIDAIRRNTVTFCLGPAGTGKTYLAMAMAITAFKNEQVGRIILTRPAIEAGEKLGFLPGDLQSKIDPYLRPLYDALYQIMGAESFQRNMEKGLIEVAPLAYMRGRTLDNAFIILDEAQNTTPAQMKMFLTRIGFGSKVVVTGDMTQKDLPRDTVSGLEVATKVLSKVEEIAFIKLTNKDVVRHPLVQKIVKAYEDYEENQAKAAKRREARKGSQTGRRKN